MGDWLQGGLGVDGGMLPGPGWYVTSFGYLYPVTSTKGPNGGSTSGRRHLTVSAYAVVLSAITKTKFLGADCGFQVFMPVAKQRVSSTLFPNLSAQEFGYSDTYFSSLELGCHKGKWDTMFTYSFNTQPAITIRANSRIPVSASSQINSS